MKEKIIVRLGSIQEKESQVSTQVFVKKLDGNHTLLYYPYTCILMCRGLSKILLANPSRCGIAHRPG